MPEQLFHSEPDIRQVAVERPAEQMHLFDVLAEIGDKAWLDLQQEVLRGDEDSGQIRNMLAYAAFVDRERLESLNGVSAFFDKAIKSARETVDSYLSNAIFRGLAEEIWPAMLLDNTLGQDLKDDEIEELGALLESELRNTPAASLDPASHFKEAIVIRHNSVEKFRALSVYEELKAGFRQRIDPEVTLNNWQFVTATAVAKMLFPELMVPQFTTGQWEHWQGALASLQNLNRPESFFETATYLTLATAKRVDLSPDGLQVEPYVKLNPNGSAEVLPPQRNY